MNITNAKDMTNVGATLLLYGESGTGKTSSLGTLRGKTLVIDIEGGSVVLRGKDVDIVSVPSDLAGLKGLFDEITLNASSMGYANICLDSATELQSFMLVALGKKQTSGTPSLNDYGVVNFKMREYMRKLRDLRDLGINVVVTALEMPVELEHDEDVTRTKMFPMMSRKLAPEICGLFDVVARLGVSDKEGHKGERYMLLDGDDGTMAKNRYGNAKYWLNADIGAFLENATSVISAVPAEVQEVKPAKAKKHAAPVIPVDESSTSQG